MVDDNITGQHSTVLLVDDLVGEQLVLTAPDSGPVMRCGYDPETDPRCLCLAGEPLVLDPTAETTGPIVRCTACDKASEDIQDCCEQCEACCECMSCSASRCDWRGREGYCSDCDTCEDCCAHWTCEDCERRYQCEDTSPCRICGHCTERCCSCRFCEGCTETYREDHPWCRNRDDAQDHCESCCECNGDCRIMVRRDPRFYLADNAHRKVNKSARLVGMEIEVAATHDSTDKLERVCAAWRHSIVEDGSLNPGGFEINTSPAAGDYLSELLGELGASLRDADARVDGHCGLHVHVDCRDFTFYDMRKLVKLYAKIEPALFAMMPGSRRRNTYCRPCGERFVYDLDNHRIPKDSKRRLLTNVTDSVPDSRWKDQRESKGGRFGSRYNALNLQSWLYRGTIECRLHTGTVSARKLTCWALLWQAIVDFAYKTTEKDIDDLGVCDDLADSRALLVHIAPSADVAVYINERIQAFRSHGTLLPEESD